MSSFSTAPQSFYLSSIDALLAWTPGTQAFDNFNIAQVPLRPRPAISGALVEDCSDFKGGYVSQGDLFPQGVATIDTYNFTFWEYLDNFCYFAHHRINVPTTWWINAAHLHGVPVIGTIDFEGSSLSDMTTMLGNSTQCIQQLTAIAQHYGFEGWFFNVEINGMGAAQGSQLISFVQDLRTALRAVNPNALVVWYDSVLPNGELFYQNCLNSENNAFFGPSNAIVSDGFFPNYGWFGDPAGYLPTSVQTTSGDDRSATGVFTGVDVYGRSGGYPGNTKPGDDAIWAVGQCVNYKTSTGLFAPGWTFETAQGASPQPHHQNFEQSDISFWIGSGSGHNSGSSLTSNCIAQYIPERIVGGALPFATNFDRGCGENFVVRGNPASSAAWSNLSLEGAQPTYRYWALPGSATSFGMSFAYGAGYDGGACLVVQGTNAQATDIASYRLYDIAAQVAEPTNIQVVFNPLSPACYPQVQIRLVFSDGSFYTTSSTAAPLNGWLAVMETMTANIGKTISEVVLVVGPANNGQTPGANYGVTIGLISVAQADLAPPASVQALSAQPVYSDQATMGALLTWTYPASAARFFDIWRTDGASPQWLMRVCANTAWIPNLGAIGTSFGCSFAIQPVDYSLNAQPLSSAATTSMQVNAMSFNDGPTITLLGNPLITGMNVMAGEILNAVQVTNGTYSLPQHGDTSGSAFSIEVASGDVIVSVSGATGVWYGWNCVAQLTFKTKNGVTYGPYGSMGGVTSSTPFSFSAPSGQSLLALSGSLVNVPLAGGSRVNIVRSLSPLFG
ncbi:endo-beta-N-acetylglucosaminidase [Collimonas silvisoli]|uniref:endo-beta-N-acetylglucosaminidase n=1 Tax=Collimonas silvisoli TaxID=2825884 RepID=UPI001B8D57AF|nr:jacalin-like lectin [Collimonas silvisoli]